MFFKYYHPGRSSVFEFGNLFLEFSDSLVFRTVPIYGTGSEKKSETKNNDDIFSHTKNGEEIGTSFRENVFIFYIVNNFVYQSTIGVYQKSDI